jgi:cytidylate kinase
LAERGPAVVIAVDGPAAAGKRTLARRLAAHLGLRYLDSGELYRAVAARVLGAGGDPANAGQAAAAARALDEADLTAPGLRDEAVAAAASVVAAIPEVRTALLAYQRAFGRVPPGAVIDGRDIGTVVFPDASHKLFVTASLEVRAERRHRELLARGVGSDRAGVRREMAERDERDRRRAVAPLARAADAHVLDTTDLDADAAFAAALAHVAAGDVGDAPR